MKSRSRLIDVARLAGVSSATVSAVVNNAIGPNIRVSAETQRRVWQAVAQLGYVANPSARILAGGKNRVLGIFTYEPIFPFQNHDFFYPFLVGIEEEAEHQGYHLMLYTNVSDGSRRSIYHGETNLLNLSDGAILLGLNENKDELLRLEQEGYPFVYVGRRDVPGVKISYTASDYTAATALLTGRLAQLDHRNLVYIAPPQRIESSIDRETGFLQSCSQYGLTNTTLYRATADITVGFAQELLDAGVTAALIEFDDQCHALLTALNTLGRSVPRDFSIVMLGDPHYAWDNSPDWTTFRIPRREMGIEAVRLLIHRLNDPQDENHRTALLPCQIVEGSTIGPTPGQR